MAMFYIYKDTANEYRWYLKSANNEKVADSGEGYISHDGVISAINWMQKYTAGADIKDSTRSF